ncbi:MAG: hypothetical protein Q8R29_02710 [bacterium]|nr:hypothetical protein [bacterium]
MDVEIAIQVEHTFGFSPVFANGATEVVKKFEVLMIDRKITALAKDFLELETKVRAIEDKYAGGGSEYDHTTIKNDHWQVVQLSMKQESIFKEWKKAVELAKQAGYPLKGEKMADFFPPPPVIPPSSPDKVLAILNVTAP